MRSNKLTPKNGGTEGDDREDEHSDIFSTLGSRSHLRRGGQSRKLVDTSANSRKGHAADEDVHRVRSRADDHAQYDESRSDESDISSTEEIGQRTDKGADCSEGQQVGEDEPDPSVSTTNVCIDVRRNL